MTLQLRVNQLESQWNENTRMSDVYIQTNLSFCLSYILELRLILRLIMLVSKSQHNTIRKVRL